MPPADEGQEAPLSGIAFTFAESIEVVLSLNDFMKLGRKPGKPLEVTAFFAEQLRQLIETRRRRVEALLGKRGGNALDYGSGVVARLRATAHAEYGERNHDSNGNSIGHPRTVPQVAANRNLDCRIGSVLYFCLSIL